MQGSFALQGSIERVDMLLCDLQTPELAESLMDLRAWLEKSLNGLEQVEIECEVRAESCLKHKLRRYPSWQFREVSRLAGQVAGRAGAGGGRV